MVDRLVKDLGDGLQVKTNMAGVLLEVSGAVVLRSRERVRAFQRVLDEACSRIREEGSTYNAGADFAETPAAVASAGLNDLRDEALRIAVEHGFTDATVGEDIALMHSELSEALEDHRAGNAPTRAWYMPAMAWHNSQTGETGESHLDVQQPPGIDKPRKPCGIPSELADVIIRVLHFSGKHGIDIEKAVREKMAYNASRPFKHGGKTI